MAWTARGLKNAQWAAQLEASRLADDERLLQDASARRQADDAAAEEARLARERKRPRLGKIHLDRDTPSYLPPRPCAYALHKLEKGEYVELWYFTLEGCAAAANECSTAQEAHRASRHVLPDEKLTWDQYCIGKSDFQLAISAADWPATHVAMLEAFFYTLSRHPFTRRPRGKDALITYQARVRRHWHEQLARDEGYNISKINLGLLNGILRELLSSAQEERISRVRSSTCPSLSCSADSCSFLLCSLHPTFVVCPTCPPDPRIHVAPTSLSTYLRRLPSLCSTYCQCDCILASVDRLHRSPRRDAPARAGRSASPTARRPPGQDLRSTRDYM